MNEVNEMLYGKEEKEEEKNKETEKEEGGHILHYNDYVDDGRITKESRL